MPPPSLFSRPFKSTIIIGLLVLCLLSFSLALDSEEANNKPDDSITIADGRSEETVVIDQTNEDALELNGETFGHRNDDNDDDDDDDKKKDKRPSDRKSDNDDDDDWEEKWEMIKDEIKDRLDDDDDDDKRGNGGKDDSKKDNSPSRKSGNDDDDDDDFDKSQNRPNKHDNDDDDDDDKKPHNVNANDDDDKKPHNSNEQANDHADDHNEQTPEAVEDHYYNEHHVPRHHYVVLKGALGCFVIGWFVLLGGLRYSYVSLFTFGVLFFESLLFLMFPLGHSSCSYFVYGVVSLLLSALLLKFTRLGLLVGAFLMSVVIASVTTTAIFGPIMSLYVWVVIFVGAVLSCCNLVFPKLGLILSSSFLGSFMVVTSFDMLTGNNGGLITAIPELLDGDNWVRGLTWFFIILFYLLAAVGFFAQLLCLSRRKGQLFDRVLCSDAPTDNAGYDSFDDGKEMKKTNHGLFNVPVAKNVAPVGGQAN